MMIYNNALIFYGAKPMKRLTALMLTALLLAPVVSTPVWANDAIKAQALNDPNFTVNRQKAIDKLQHQGFTVTEIEVDDHRGKPVLEVEAVKEGRKYDIKLSYPALKILKQKIDR